MAGRGGFRPGAGRPTKNDEVRVRDLCLSAIEEYYGGVKEGLIELLKSGEPALIKFAWAHAIGNPKEHVDIDMMANVEQVQIIQLPDNGRDSELLNGLPSAN